MIAHTAKTIIVNFLQRDHGFTESEAIAELEVLYVNNIPCLRTHYLTVRRTGLKAVGNRANRNFIFDSFENACNHATFAV